VKVRKVEFFSPKRFFNKSILNVTIAGIFIFRIPMSIKLSDKIVKVFKSFFLPSKRL
jgi:hypothetical protein